MFTSGQSGLIEILGGLFAIDDRDTETMPDGPLTSPD